MCLRTTSAEDRSTLALTGSAAFVIDSPLNTLLNILFFVYTKIQNVLIKYLVLHTCSWNGIKSDLNEHTNSAHRRCCLGSPTLLSLHVSENLAILSCFGELFTYYQLIQNGRFYGAIQATGKSSVASKYKSEFTFRAANGIEEISKILFVRRYTDDLKQVSENSAQHVGQHWTLSFHLLQMLWLFVQSFMGGTMYCMHTGHTVLSTFFFNFLFVLHILKCIMY